MAKPVLLTVDDDPAVSQAVARDLRSHYGADYRVLRADSGETALATLRELAGRGDPVALLLADHRMPQMNGVQFLGQARALFPRAKRVLLTAYADTEAAISAINEIALDHYLLKPWDPPSQRLYPVLDDLLGDWQGENRPAFAGVRVLGHKWSARSHDVRDFLARNQVPALWVDVETDALAGELLAAAGLSADEAAPDSLPVVFVPGGDRPLFAPSHQQLAAEIGLSTRAELPFYDLVVVGGGPAGLAASVYGASEGLRTVLVEQDATGGQAGQSSLIENYLGFPSGISGDELTRRATTQARRFGAEMVAVSEVCGLSARGSARVVTLADGSELSAHAVVLATGVSYRRLDVPGLDALTGRGVYYGAATTEAMSCRDDDVVVVGGANSAGQAALYFAATARSVTVLVRGPDLAASMSHYLVARIEAAPTITVRTSCSVVGVSGEGHLQSLTLQDTVTGAREEVAGGWLFIFIGAQPRTAWLAGTVERDERGYVLAGRDLVRDGRVVRQWPLDREPMTLETSVPGVFVAGDARHDSVKRVASAVGEGSMAVQFVHRYLATP